MSKETELAQFNLLAAPVLEWLKQGAPHVKVNKAEIGFNMSVVNDSDYAEDYAENTCGTACCIAGAIGQFNYKNDFLKPFFKKYRKIYGDEGAKLSEYLDESMDILKRAFPSLADELQELFVPDKLYLDDITPKQAHKTLKKFMKTGTVEWEMKGD